MSYQPGEGEFVLPCRYPVRHNMVFHGGPNTQTVISLFIAVPETRRFLVSASTYATASSRPPEVTHEPWLMRVRVVFWIIVP